MDRAKEFEQYFKGSSSTGNYVTQEEFLKAKDMAMAKLIPMFAMLRALDPTALDVMFFVQGMVKLAYESMASDGNKESAERFVREVQRRLDDIFIPLDK